MKNNTSICMTSTSLGGSWPKFTNQDSNVYFQGLNTSFYNSDQFTSPI